MNKDKDWYLRRAITGFKTLVVYFCVTRPQYERAYRKGGKFSIEELIRQESFLASWKFKSRKEKKRLFNLYKIYSRNSNYTFGIPRNLVYEIIGKYKGKRISKGEVIGKLQDDGWLEVLDHGSKISKDESGEWKKVYSFSTKYKIANRDYWFKLLSDPMYSDYTKYKRDDEGFVQRAVEIISRWRKSVVGAVEEVVIEYTDPNKLLLDFLKGYISEHDFMKIARGQFNIEPELVERAIRARSNTENANETTNHENATDEAYEDKQGQEVSDETSCQTQEADKRAS